MVGGVLLLGLLAFGVYSVHSCYSAVFAKVDEASDTGAWLRRVEMDGEYRDFDAAGRDLGRAEEAWTRVRPTLVPQAADEVDATMAACRGAADERADVALRHASHAAMDVIDSARRR
jgi:hypothetical protein